MPLDDTTTLYKDERLVLTREHAGKIVRFRRTHVPSTIEWLDQIAASMGGLVARSERSRLGLLVDTRDAPLADAATEERLAAASPRILNGYRRTVVLVRTAVGKLQMRRLNRERAEQRAGDPLVVFSDEAEAIAYLLEAD
jgi:hypothetical protein